MKKIVIFASGNGTNALALIKKAKTLASKIIIKGIICDNPKAGIIAKAKENGVDCIVVVKKATKSEHEQAILKILQDWEIDWIFLAGYMRILSPSFIQHFDHRIINIHPSMLPQFPGREAYQQAWKEKVPVSGVSIHYVDEGVDTGEIIIQEKFPRLPSDTFEIFKARGLELEHKLYPKILEWVADEKL